MELKDYLDLYKNKFEKEYKDFIEIEEHIPVIYEAMDYSLKAGGKRIRSALFEMTSDFLGYHGVESLSFEVAFEMIHTYSLIHDDLPSMDNDSLRRGIPTNHVVYGENFAILAGDGLLNKAYEILFKAVLDSDNKQTAKAANYVAMCAGTKGMIGGQALDLYYENKKADFNIIKEMHKRKTGALIKAPIISACILSGKENIYLEKLEAYGDAIGLAFQITDDILDSIGTEDKLGKTIGKDSKNKKMTYVTEFGLEESKKLANEQNEKALEALSEFGNEADMLRELAYFIINRES